MTKLVGSIVVAILLILVLCGPAGAQSRLIWADESGHSITWSFTDGSNVTETAGSTPVNVTIDQRLGWVYWLTANYGHGVYGEMRRAPIHDLSDWTKLYGTSYTEGGMVADHSDGRVYWSAPTGPMPKPFSILRTRTDESGWEIWLENIAELVGGLDLDARARLIFWTDGNALMRANLDTGVIEEVNLDWGPIPKPYFDGGVAVDTVGLKVYWAERGSYFGSPEGKRTRVFRTGYAGGVPEVVLDENHARITHLAFEAVSRALYWDEAALRDGESTLLIRRASVNEPLPLSGSDVVSPSHPPRKLAVFADPGPADLATPLPNAAVETSVTLDWEPVLGSQRYDIIVTADPTFNSIVFKENIPGTKADFVAPVAETPYYWRVQSNACFIAPHWSETRMFVVGDTGPLAARLTAPAPDAVVQPMVDFEWEGAPNAIEYTFQIARTSDFAPVLVSRRELTETKTSVSGLERGETLYWRVAGIDDVGRYTFTAPRGFAVAELLSAAELVEPADGTVGAPAYAEFVWRSLEGAIAYEIEISTLADFTDLAFSGLVEDTRFVVEQPLSYESTYYWRVRGVNESGPGAWSKTWSFTVAVGTPTENLTDIPQETKLGKPYPNPASTSLILPFELAESSETHIDVFDLSGRLVARIESGPDNAGRHARRIDISSWRSGLYVAVLNDDFEDYQLLFVVR